MNDKIIGSFADFHAMVQSYAAGHYIFRGEPGANYRLRPKFGRSGACTREDCLEIEIGSFESFTRRGAPFVSPTPPSHWEWLAIAQHYGLATRLLDWTENPLVAAYFALAGDLESNRVIYALDRSTIPLPDLSESPFRLEEVVLYEPSHVSTRIAAQAGIFTVHDRPGDTFSSESLERWVIRSEAVNKLSIEIDGYGFNRSTLFPGLEGIASHVNDWHLRGNRDD